MTRKRRWKWHPHGQEYQVSFHKNEWQVRPRLPRHVILMDINLKVLASDSDDNPEIVGTFAVSFRPHLIRKEKPLSLNLSRKALENDEVFLMLLLIYSEAKRQEDSVSFAFASLRS